MRSSMRVAAVVVLLFAAATGTPSYPPPAPVYEPAPVYQKPAPCYPEVKYVTQYQTKVQQVSRRRYECYPYGILEGIFRLR